MVNSVKVCPEVSSEMFFFWNMSGPAVFLKNRSTRYATEMEKAIEMNLDRISEVFLSKDLSASTLRSDWTSRYLQISLSVAVSMLGLLDGIVVLRFPQAAIGVWGTKQAFNRCSK